MDGSSSQRRTDPPMSSINAFPFEEMYTPEFLDSFQQNTGTFQEPAREDSPVEAVATSSPKTKKPTRARQKRTIQSDNAPRQTAWTHEEEIALCKGWVDVSKNNMLGNSRKEAGFWCAVLAYMVSKTKQYGRRTYDMVNGKWKTVRPTGVRFCGVYGNVMRRGQESGASDEDYFERALMDYQAETGTTFKYRHCWEILKNSPKWMKSEVLSKRYKSSESSSDKAIDAGKKKGSRVLRASGSSSMNDEALARLMVTEMTSQEKEQREVFLEIKMREVKCREREVRNQEYRQRQDDIRFYLQPYDHLTRDARLAMEKLRAEFKAKYDLPY
ncbi:glutathione S-transferase T3-like protein [Tanacetum coccineum]